MKSLRSFPDMMEMVNRSHLEGIASDEFHRIAAGEEVVSGDAFAAFDHVSNLAALERTRDVVAEKSILRGDLVSSALGLEGLPASLIVSRVGYTLTDSGVVPETDEQLVDKRPIGRPENICIDAAGDPIIRVEDDIRVWCHHELALA
jgi:hypothetical protein